MLRADLDHLTPYSAHLVPGDARKLDANEAPLDLPPTLKEKLARYLVTELSSNRYPDGVYGALRQAIAHYAGVPAAWIAIGNGSDELIRSLLLVSALHRGGILVADPTFSMYGILAQTLGIPVHRLERHTTDWAWDLTAANKAIAQEAIAIVFLVHPNSPTGNSLTAQERDWLAGLPPNVLVVIDEAYFEYAQNTLVSELPQHPNWVVLRTFSKGFRLAAYRVGYAIAQPHLVTALEKVRLPYNLPTLSAHAALLALEHRQELLGDIPQLLQERDRLYAAWQAWSPAQIQIWPSTANFLYLRTSHDRALQEFLQQRNIWVRRTGGGLRITVGTAPENHHLRESWAQFWEAL
jgi:histidinol-phosphate aminotransferase